MAGNVALALCRPVRGRGHRFVCLSFSHPCRTPLVAFHRRAVFIVPFQVVFLTPDQWTGHFFFPVVIARACSWFPPLVFVLLFPLAAACVANLTCFFHMLRFFNPGHVLVERLNPRAASFLQIFCRGFFFFFKFLELFLPSLCVRPLALFLYSFPVFCFCERLRALLIGY